MVIEDGLTIGGKPLRDVYEALGHAKAYDKIHLLAKRKSLEESDILNLHKLFYQLIDKENAGKYRTVPVFISGSHYALTPPQKIPSEMKKFVEWFNKNESKMNTVEFAAKAHQKFVFIHPFVDGNGRVARLLRNNLKPKKGAVRHRETGESLSERILSEIRVNPGINTPALASMLNLSLRTTQRQLQALSESGKIEFRGARKNGGYYLVG